MHEKIKLELYGDDDSHLFTITHEDYDEWMEDWLEPPGEDWPLCSRIEVYAYDVKLDTIYPESRCIVAKMVKQIEIEFFAGMIARNLEQSPFKG